MKLQKEKRGWGDRRCPVEIIRSVVVLGCALSVVILGAAESTQPGKNLGDLSIEELMNESVTSVSKREQRLGDAPAAISVLTNDDLRRSGVTSVAEALRLVPGLQVAAIDSSTWAVSARGFNSQFSNKLLVMIDGRTVYSPLFSGVYWDAQQVFLDDVDRIEVIRGPGATVWGANAVNGVISVISKSARDTQGGLVYGGGGDVQHALGGARYGGRIGESSYYRAYGLYQRNGEFRQANGEPANDGWDLVKGGFRVDQYARSDGQLTWQADVYTGNLAGDTGYLSGFNTLGRWVRSGSNRSSYEMQAYVDRTYRSDVLSKVRLDTIDLSYQHTFGLGERNDVIWGLGYRFTDTRLIRANSPVITIVDHEVPLDVFSAFVQDAFIIVPKQLTFTVGTKLEHNDFTGIEVQPSARLAFKPHRDQTVWAAISRAVRTPSETEGMWVAPFVSGAPAAGPDGGLYLPTIVGNLELKSEVLWAYEVGYRARLNHRFSADFTLFHHVYSGLLEPQPADFIPGEPVGVLTMPWANALHAESRGGETSLNFAASGSWRISLSYSLLRLHVQGASAGVLATPEQNAPTHQIVVRSSYDIGRHFSVDTHVRYVDKVEAVAAYVAADLRFSYRPSAKLEMSLVGQDLLDSQHPEQTSSIGAPTIEVPRRFYGKITWRF